MSALATGVSGHTLAREDRPGLESALAAGAAQYPERSAAVWLLTAHGAWITDVAFLECVRINHDGTLRVQWVKFARLAAGTLARHHDVAIALSACQIAGFTLDPPGHPEGKPTPAGVLERDEYRCVYCGDVAETMDHVLPYSRGGATSWENLRAACMSCNNLKADRTPEELGWAMHAPPSHWTQDRIAAALGPRGRALVVEAHRRRDQHAAELASTIDDGLTALFAALHIPTQGRDHHQRALLRSVADRLAAEAKTLEPIGATA